MASRAKKYGTTYVPAYRMAIRWEQIQADVKAEGERAKEAADVAAQERAALADLDARFAAEGVSPDVLAGYLAAVGAERQAGTRARAGAQAVQAQADAAARRLLNAPRPTQELVDALTATGRAPSPSLAAQLQNRLAATPAAAAAVAALRPGGTGAPGGPSVEVVEQRELIRLTAPEAAFSPATQPLVDQRAVTPVAAKGAESLSEAQLLAAYTTALQGGTGGDLGGRFQAALGAIAPADADPQALLAAADQLYTRVRQEGSFSRQDRKFFEPTWLAAADAARVATEEAERLKPGYTDPAREAARREIAARGLNPDDRYVALVGDRRYDYLTAADRIYGEVDGVVKPATPEQMKIAEFVSYLKRESDRTGKPIDLKTIERQLGKTLKGKALVEGVGFALALARSESEQPEDRKTQADLQREAEVTAQRLQEIAATREAAAAEAARIEAELATEIDVAVAEAGAKAAVRPVRPGAAVPVAADIPGIPGGPRTGATGRPAGALGAAYTEQVESAGREAATRQVVQALREGGDLRTNALRLRAIGYSNDQIRAIVAAARSPATPETPTGKTFVDWSDPKRPTYTRNPDGTITGPDGRKIASQLALAALSVVERGETPANRAALAKIQAQARAQARSQGSNTGRPSGEEPPAGQGREEELKGEGTPVKYTPPKSSATTKPAKDQPDSGWMEPGDDPVAVPPPANPPAASAPSKGSATGNTSGGTPPKGKPKAINEMTDDELRALIGE